MPARAYMHRLMYLVVFQFKGMCIQIGNVLKAVKVLLSLLIFVQCVVKNKLNT